ncbi:unnamed protein product [Lymnaea stagnalis]|uniref:Uncharacterized protein n=1 Tax=Lymnaea stagnalis TaxID=6523 RepID=A0AAV2HTD5_LYMST
MGNSSGKTVSTINRCTGQSEASQEEGRLFDVRLPDDTTQQQLVFPKQTAYTLKENVCQKYPYKQNYDVVLVLNSKAQLILQDNLEFEDHFNEIDKIHIVPRGAMQVQPADNTSLNDVIKLKS